MIDTDKYEGHTPAPWKPTRLSNKMWTVGNLSVEWQEADKLLIADTPLLLAEVKRLRYIAKNCLEAIEAGGDRETGTMMLIKENLKGMIEDVDISN